ncbi:hypothetical protein E8E15_003687 [Penicillium rubens]|uniref:Pc18g02480 protein n=2 Tax=Penicillium chrysogenum species complex TaxID=254878 RepID=B6HCX2_PENRW|nr:uncharacterized protein N7525_000737 [Penicillium rubens]XP_056566076.1 uncharacterized protein N7489_006611 [Penicillium chrysogenum]CAP94472.1 Pc18g02480 [Penicillium rubens Wisconsin 54-1255]KAF3012925.1 hypothetical protein E8E15_003687 [Penicillium rubens]KAJ5039546.1 hypothetical protein NUH16_009329 [Penicillium rubens]KAJ5236520.1 hypothetical protein N7489_006611 [Penicillium chrysogenum]KAJ5255424.1 hypothetical protein N7505_010575 [Penicillium chrysogenum]
MSYQIAYDKTRAPPRGAALVAFMEDFYRTSDTEPLHEKYVQSFTEDATLIMGPKEAKGASAILTLRHGLWTHVASRRHTPTQIYFGGDDEIMLYGGVNYRLKADPDNEVYVPWAGRVVFAPQKGDEDIKMRFYQVYLDTAAQSGKK